MAWLVPWRSPALPCPRPRAFVERPLPSTNAVALPRTVSRYGGIVASGPKTRGFSAVELMNFLALAAVLTAVGMYSIARYVRHAKTAEAQSSLASLATSAASFYDTSDATQPTGASKQDVQAMRHFPPSSRVSVPEDPLTVRAQRYQSNMADWAASPWRDLHFSIVQPQCYQYAFDATGAGASAKATVTAEGDLDGDGHRSLYSIVIEAGPTLRAQIGPIAYRDAEE